MLHKHFPEFLLKHCHIFQDRSRYVPSKIKHSQANLIIPNFQPNFQHFIAIQYKPLKILVEEEHNS